MHHGPLGVHLLREHLGLPVQPGGHVLASERNQEPDLHRRARDPRADLFEQPSAPSPVNADTATEPGNLPASLARAEPAT